MSEDGDKPDLFGAAADSLQRLGCEVTQFPDVLGVEGRQFAFLPIGPEILHRIELGSVGGQVGNGDSVGVLLQHLADGAAAVDLGAIPDDQPQTASP